MQAPDGVRPHVADSWVRSVAAGVGADQVEAPITLESDNLLDHRQAHPLAQIFPLLDDVLGRAARECDAIMAVSDAAGQLLWVCGSPSVLRKAERIGFVEGSNWDERLSGTNAPGMALTLGEPVSIVGSEHFRTSVKGWSCAAAPIHDPITHSVLGVVDVTGGDQIVVPQTMGMVRAAARMAEAELAREMQARAFQNNPDPTPAGRLHIQALGRREALVTLSDRRGSTIRLSPRHSEIVLLLASAPRGLSGDELTVLLYEDEVPTSTLRVELNRLRSLLGEEVLLSRPYRLACEVSADWLAVEAYLSAGATGPALHGYRGPVLPASTAPGVVRVRENLAEGLRSALLTSGEADLLSTWTRSAWGADDYEMWQAQLKALAPNSPLRPLVMGQLNRLDRDFGVRVPRALFGARTPW